MSKSQVTESADTGLTAEDSAKAEVDQQDGHRTPEQVIERANKRMAVVEAEQKYLADMKRKEKETGKLTYYVIFCHPLDRWSCQRAIEEELSRGCITLTDRVQRGSPLIDRLEMRPEDIKVLKFPQYKKKLREESWARLSVAEKNKPRGKNEVRLPYPHVRQKSIIYHKKRFKVMVCGRRFGKTTAALIACMLRAIEKPKSIIFYIAPTYRQAKSIAWSMLSEWVGQAYARKNEQELVLELPNGSKIYLKGADNPDSLRGTYVHFMVLDEYADIKPQVWDEVLRPQTIDTRADVWFMGTPRGFDHFHALWKDAHSGKLGDDWVAYRLTSYDNPHMPKEEIDKAREQSDPRAFAQEYLAEFVQFEGLVYADFKQAEHVQHFDIKKISGVDVVGLDWGADHPTGGAFLRFAADGKVYVWAEHYERELSVDEHAERLKRLAKGKTIRRWYLDPSAKQVGVDLKKNGINTRKAVNDRIYGITEVRRLLRDKKLIIHPSCSNLIYEFQHHRYKTDQEKSRGSDKDVDKSVLKIDDDLLDALRYGVASHFRGKDHGSSNRQIDHQIPAGARVGFDKVNLENNKSKNRNKPNRVAKEFEQLYN
jgi:phage terminase large subunit